MDRNTLLGMAVVLCLAGVLGASSMLLSGSSDLPRPTASAPVVAHGPAPDGEAPEASAAPSDPDPATDAATDAVPDGDVLAVGDDPMSLRDLFLGDEEEARPETLAGRIDDLRGKGIFTTKLDEMHAARVEIVHEIAARDGWAQGQEEEVVALLDDLREDALDTLAALRDGEVGPQEARTRLADARDLAARDLQRIIGPRHMRAYKREVASRSRD